MDRQESILESLEEIGRVLDHLREKIMQEENMERLKKWCHLVARVRSVEEFQERYQREI